MPRPPGGLTHPGLRGHPVVGDDGGDRLSDPGRSKGSPMADPDCSDRPSCALRAQLPESDEEGIQTGSSGIKRRLSLPGTLWSGTPQGTDSQPTRSPSDFAIATASSTH